jgi:hypothetical protein
MAGKQRIFLWIKPILLSLVPIALWLLPSTFFDQGETICPSKRFFGIECFGCGMTRAVMHFHHFDFSKAIFYNYGVVAIYPALVVIWLVWVRKTWAQVHNSDGRIK